jgi:helicase
VLGALRGRRQTAENVLANAGRADPSMSEVEAADVGTDGGEPSSSAGQAARRGTEANDEEDQSNLGDF